MNRTVTLLMAVSMIGGGSVAHGIEGAGMRALQSGPVGEGLAFYDYGPADVEVSARYVGSNGTERTDDEARAVAVAAGQLAFGAGFGISRDFGFKLELNHESVSTKMTGDLATSSVTSSDRAASELIAGPTLWVSRIMLAAHASVLALGESRARTDDGSTTIGSAVMPRLRLYSGIKSGALTGMARVLLYNDVRASVRGNDSETGDSQTTAKRRTPGEASLDMRLVVHDGMALAASADYVQSAQADRRTLKNHLTFAGGCTITPAPWVSLAGSIRYTEPYFAGNAAPSLVVDNLGGMAIAIGGTYSVNDVAGHFSLSHGVPRLVTYTEPDTNESSQAERSRWDLTVGMTFKAL